MKFSEVRNQNIVVMTGNDLRHQYFIRQLNASFNIAATFIESSDYPVPPPGTEEESKAWSWFFERRQMFEKNTIIPRLNIENMNKPDVYYLKKSALNSQKTFSLINKYSPGFIAVFGTGVIKENFLSLYPDSIYNLHVGIPAFYRGSSCNFWPIHNCDLKNLGATIHRVEAGIDTGKIAAESRIRLESTDNEQTLTWKTLQTGTQLMLETIKKWKSGALNLEKQKRTGKLYKMNDLNPAAILKVKRMVESGELKSQLKSAIS